MNDLKRLIEHELEHYLEWPTADKSAVTTVSAKLFAEHVARLWAGHVADTRKMVSVVQGEPVGWQTIETAPKDGTTILVWFKQHGAMTVCWGDRDYDHTSEYAAWLVDDHKHGPYPVRGYSRGDDTHWIPLPDAPQSSEPPAALSDLPGSLPMGPYQTVDRSSPHYKAGWNACRRAMLASLEKLIATHHEAHRKQGGGQQ